jgi:F420-non-reducing hydrogenase iron-sulfur subunit
LDQIGLEAERIEMFNLSSAMGPQFAQYATDMSGRIRELGLSPLRNGSSLAGKKSQAARRLP